jgi:hypothetical protein
MARSICGAIDEEQKWTNLSRTHSDRASSKEISILRSAMSSARQLSRLLTVGPPISPFRNHYQILREKQSRARNLCSSASPRTNFNAPSAFCDDRQLVVLACIIDNWTLADRHHRLVADSTVDPLCARLYSQSVGACNYDELIAAVLKAWPEDRGLDPSRLKTSERP